MAKAATTTQGVHGWPGAPLRIIAIGGGTGLSAMLHGLRPFSHLRTGAGPALVREPRVDIAAVVTVTDDGGSSGRLRREFKVLPPGDIRNCMVALSEDEALLSRLFQYRFAAGRGLRGHSFGNLFLTALSNITGDFAQAVRVSSEVLAIAGRIYPATAANVALEAQLEDGSTVRGETRISRSRSRIRTISLTEKCSPLPETLDAIAAADLIVLGPGSLFTSVVPNLLVDGIPEAIATSQAVKAYIVNLMWQPRETIGFTAADHVATLYEHAGVKLLDYAIVNTRPISDAMLRRYAAQHSRPVENDMERLRELGVAVVGRDLLQEGEKVRHAPEAVATLALELAREGRKRRADVRPQVAVEAT
jgi:uncharacterized cofD-like protein